MKSVRGVYGKRSKRFTKKVSKSEGVMDGESGEEKDGLR